MSSDLSKIRADLKSYGITDVQEIIYNPSYDLLYKEEMDQKLEGYEKGQLSNLGAVNVLTGRFTGRGVRQLFLLLG